MIRDSGQRRFGAEILALLAAVFLLLPSIAICQIINVRTVPLLSCDQFALFPSVRSGMGGVAIAVDDELADAFVNPAKSRRLRRGFAFAAPIWNAWSFAQSRSTTYSPNEPDLTYTTREEEISSSSVLSIPIGRVNRGATTSYGFSIAYQAVTAYNRHSWQNAPPMAPAQNDSRFRGKNLPLSLWFGVDVPGTHLAVGAGLDAVIIGGIDGVSLLYPDNVELEQKGAMVVYRAGLAGSLSAADEISVLGLRHTFQVEHDASYLNSTRRVRNKDRNDGWLLQAEYRRLLTENLRAGLQFTGNWKSHPKIPNYPLAGIPRDPGTTRAFNYGIGLGWRNETTLIAVDAIYEPIDTKTWVEAETDVWVGDDKMIRRGEITMRNDYSFSNRLLRVGMEVELADWLRVKAGSQVHFYEYDYYQEDVIARLQRRVSPQGRWTEVTWTGGASMRWGDFELLYTLRMVTGQGLLTVAPRPWTRLEADFAKADFLIPPSDWMSLRPVPVFNHQVTLIYRLNH